MPQGRWQSHTNPYGVRALTCALYASTGERLYSGVCTVSSTHEVRGRFALIFPQSQAKRSPTPTVSMRGKQMRESVGHRQSHGTSATHSTGAVSRYAVPQSVTTRCAIATQPRIRIRATSHSPNIRPPYHGETPRADSVAPFGNGPKRMGADSANVTPPLLRMTEK